MPARISGAERPIGACSERNREIRWSACRLTGLAGPPLRPQQSSDIRGGTHRPRNASTTAIELNLKSPNPSPSHTVRDLGKQRNGPTIDRGANVARLFGTLGRLTPDARPPAGGTARRDSRRRRWPTRSVPRRLRHRAHRLTRHTTRRRTPSPDPSPSARSVAGAVAGKVHEEAISCLVWWQVTTGVAPDSYAPPQQVTRAQMASFVARTHKARPRRARVLAGHGGRRPRTAPWLRA